MGTLRLKIEYLSNGELRNNINLKQGFCKHYKDVKIGSLWCQNCKFFENSNCNSKKNLIQG